ncbi:MAG: O-antigen ligase family protein [Actinomycetota bacterium]
MNATTMRFGVGPPVVRPRQEVTGYATTAPAVLSVAAAIIFLPLIKPSGPANLGPVDPFIAGAILMVLLWAGTVGSTLHAPFALSMLTFVGAGAIAALSGPVPLEGFLAIVQDIVLLGWCLALVNFGSSPTALTTVVRVWAASAILWAIVLIAGVTAGIDAISGRSATTGARASLTLGDPNVAATFFFIGFMLVWASKWPRNALLRRVGYLAILWAVLLTGSNGGVLVTVAGIAIAAIAGVWRRWGILVAIAAGTATVLIGGSLVMFLDTASLQQWAQASDSQVIRDGLGRSSSSADDRQVLFGESMALYKTGGILGRGPRSTKHVLAQEQAPRIKEAHNDYAAALVERGILGAVALSLLVGSVIFRSVAIVGDRTNSAYEEAIPRPQALLGAVAGCLVAGMFYEVLHFRHVWALFGVVGAMYLWGRR